MAWAKIFGLIGILTELGGFVVLAAELLRTNRDIVHFTHSLGGTITTAQTMMVSDGPEGAITMEGGTLGSMSPAARLLNDQVDSGRGQTYIGLALTALGVGFQFFGTWYS